MRKLTSFIATSPVSGPAEVWRLIEKLELHYTPRHGSIGSRIELEREVVVWQTKRNGQAVGINWHLSTAEARIKLKHLYPFSFVTTNFWEFLLSQHITQRGNDFLYLTWRNHN